VLRVSCFPLSVTHGLRRLALLCLALGTGAAAFAPPALAVSFKKSTLSGTSLSAPTSLQWGPDGKLYVASQDGSIKAYTVTGTGTGDAPYAVSSEETIGLIKEMPNRDDDGSLSPTTKDRLVTGIAVTGTAQTPVIYAVSSDPRIGGGESGGDLDLDTNSGILSKLTKSNGTWSKQDLVRGLPRSEENHTANGLALSPDGQTLYIAQGGNTNAGAPSKNFALLPEYALGAAILSVDLGAVQGGYDLPTLNRAPGAAPFGGNDGLTQAKLVPGGPVQVYAPGFRNPYDVVLTSAGKMFTVDNGANSGWGDVPVGEGPAGTCTNTVNEPGDTTRDSLHHITGPGYYGGHPNPTRANTANTFGGQSPVAAGNPVECDYRGAGDENGAGKENGSLVSFGFSTNGLAEYTASAFAGDMKGDLVTVSQDGTVQRLEVTGTASATKSTIATGMAFPLDVTTVGDSGPFAGTIWVADIGANSIHVLQPSEAPCASGPDSDGDGYSNTDEGANGTDPCSTASTPPDFDEDKVSDLLDDNDDNDGLKDKLDPFARDKDNGLTRGLPISYLWENEASQDLGGFFGLGFTGLMTNGTSDYLDQFDAEGMTTGGAAGVVTVDAADPGDAYTTSNDQRYGFQFGVRARPADGPFTVRTRIVGPFKGITPQNYQSMGMFIGAGDQDNYLKLTTAMVDGTGIEVLKEVGGEATSAKAPLTLPGPDYVDLYLQVDPEASTVQASYVASTNGSATPRTDVAGVMSVPSTWFTAEDRGLAVGIISTSVGEGPPFPASWDFVTVTSDRQPPPPAPPSDAPPGSAPPQGPTPPTPPSGLEPTTRDVLAPRVTDLRLSPRAFATVTRRGRKPGADLRLRLSERASIQVQIYRRAFGRRSGGRCLAPTRANRGARPCVRYVRVRGSVVKTLGAGARKIRITGRLSGRRLRAGAYKLVVVAKDAAGNRTTTRGIFFRVTR